MNKTIVLRRNGRRNGRVNPQAALRALERARAYVDKHGSVFVDMTRNQIIARIKKTREELVRKRFARCSR